VTPLKRNSKEHSREALGKPGTAGFHGRFPYNGRKAWRYSQPVGKDGKRRCFLCLGETMRHLENNGRLGKGIGKESAEEPAKAQREQLLSGTFALKSTLMGTGAEDAR